MSRPTRLWTLAVAAIVVVALAGCTSNKKDGGDDEGAADASTSTTLPKECADAARQTQEQPPDGEAAPSTTLPPVCTDALFDLSVQENGSDELKALSEAERTGYAHGVCAFASALTVEGTEAPTYAEFVETTAESWGQSEEIVEEIVALAGSLCPGQLAPLTDLASGDSNVTLRLQVNGRGVAQVSYQTSDGETLNDEVTVPWDHEIRLNSAADYRLSARIPDGEATCSIMVGDTVVVEQTATPGEEAACAATAGELRDAAR